MLLGGIARDHSYDRLVASGEGHILVGEIMTGLEERRRDDVRGAATEHEAEKALRCLIQVAGERQAFIQGWFGGSKDYRIRIHGDQKQSSREVPPTSDGYSDLCRRALPHLRQK